MRSIWMLVSHVQVTSVLDPISMLGSGKAPNWFASSPYSPCEQGEPLSELESLGACCIRPW